MKKNNLTKNLGWKVFSVFLAMLMWFAVMNITTPFEYKTFTVNLSLINKEALSERGMVVLNESELEQTRVGIRIYAKRPALDELSKLENRKNILATLNMENFDILYIKDVSDPLTVSVAASAPQTIDNYELEIVSVTPKDVTVKLDKLVSETKAVTVDRIGDAMEGYVVMPPVVEPEYITITGPKSMIDKINSVRVSVDLTNAADAVKVTASPVIYDEGNNVMKGFSTDIEEVLVNVVINKQGEIPILPPDIEGSPAEGYRILSLVCEPEFVTVLGAEEDFEALESIELPAINAEGLSESKEVVFDLREYLLNTNLSIKNGTPNEVVVTLDIGTEVVREFDIPKEQIKITGLGDGLAAYLSDTLQLTVRGLSADVESMEADEIMAEISVRGLDIGPYKLPVKFNLPENVLQLSDSEITVVIADAVEAED